MGGGGFQALELLIWVIELQPDVVDDSRRAAAVLHKYFAALEKC